MEAPTRYAPFATIFSTALSALALAARHRADRTEAERSALRSAEDALAVYFIARVVAHERVGAVMRAPFVERDEGADPDDLRAHNQHPAGSGLRRTAGELITCTRCLGPWAATLVVAGRTFAPRGSRLPIAVLALAGANSLLQAAHARLTHDGSAAESEAASTSSSGAGSRDPEHRSPGFTDAMQPLPRRERAGSSAP